MDAIINWLNGLSRNAKIALLVAVAIFTPVVGIIFSVAGVALALFASWIKVIFTVIGFVLGFVKWGSVFAIALVVGGYKVYRFIQDNGSMDEDEEEEEFSWDPFR